MIKVRIASLLGLVTLLLGVQHASAVEALSTEELTPHCRVYDSDPNGPDGIFCVRYIQGFIDGAVATDERVTYNVAAEADQQETFSKRALRNRVGARLSRFGPSVYAEFCLGEPVPLRAVVNVAIEDLLDQDLVRDKPLARDVIYATLRRVYPCQTDPE